MKRTYKNIKSNGGLFEVKFTEVNSELMNSLLRNIKSYEGIVKTKTSVSLMFNKKYLNPKRFRKIELIIREHCMDLNSNEFNTTHKEINKFAYENKIVNLCYFRNSEIMVHFVINNGLYHPIYFSKGGLKISSIAFTKKDFTSNGIKLRFMERGHKSYNSYYELIKDNKIEKRRNLIIPKIAK